MKTAMLATIVLAAAVSVATAGEEKRAPSLREQTSRSLEKAGEISRELGRDIGEGATKAREALTAATAPDKDAKKIDVTIGERDIDMPRTFGAGKTAFVVHNTDRETHNFRIEGVGLEKQFLLDIAPQRSKVLQLELKPGNYKAFCPEKDHGLHGPALELTVK